MKIESLQELQQLLKICNKQGVEHIKVDNLEIKLSGKTPPTKSQTVQEEFPETNAFDPGPIPMNPDGTPKLNSLTPEQMLMWSAAPGGIPESPNL